MYCGVQIDIGNMYLFILSRNDPNQKNIRSRLSEHDVLSITFLFYHKET